tara:strand:- start:3185 stop:4114 length:930 start_codon:yes stop_codon:yes gene_type:complete
MKFYKYLPIIGIAIFIFILVKLDVSSIIEEIKGADVNYLLIALFFLFLYTLSQTFKWFAIARVQKIEVPFWSSYKINLIGNFYGFITPSRLGSAFRLAYLKGFKGFHMGKGASNYVLDKVLDLCSVFLLAIAFSFVFKEVLSGSFLYYSTGILTLILVFLLIFRDKERAKKILGSFYRRFVPEKIKGRAKEIFESFYDGMPKKRYLILFLLLNILNWILLYTMSFFVGLSIGINVPFFYFLAILPITTLVAQIPITISGLGTREATMISLFGLLGVGATKVFSMALISLFGGIIPAIIGSFLILKSKSK